MRRSIVLVLLWALVGGCGEATPAGDSTSTTRTTTTAITLPSASTGTTAPSSTTTSPATTTTTTPAATTTTAAATTSSTAATTTIEDPSSPFRGDGTLRSLSPADDFPSGAAGTAADVAWDEVGPDWILAPIFAGNDDTGALVLIDPEDRAFVLGGWRRIHELQDWSPDGLRVAYTPRMGNRVVVVHLLSGLEGEIAAGFSADVVRFTRPTGRDVVIGRLYDSSRTIVDVYRTDGSLWSHLLEAAGMTDDWVPAGWLYGNDGMQVVVFGGHRVRLVTNRGDPIRDLPIDGTRCRVQRWWSDDEVLVSCTDPGYAETGIHGCFPGSGRELWAVPIDGSAPRPVGPETGPGGECDAPEVYEPGRADALLIGTTLAVETAGCCECGGDLEVWLPDEVLMPPLVECSPQLIGIRNGEALVHVVLIAPRWHSVIVSIDAAGQARLVAPQLWEEATAESVHLTDDAPGSG